MDKKTAIQKDDNIRILEKQTKCCGALVLIKIIGRHFYMCPCGKTRQKFHGQ